MSSDSLLQFVPLVFWTFIMAVPLYFLVKRSGQSTWLMLICLVPFLGCLILLWILAFVSWPVLAAKPAHPPSQ